MKSKDTVHKAIKVVILEAAIIVWLEELKRLKTHVRQRIKTNLASMCENFILSKDKAVPSTV